MTFTLLFMVIILLDSNVLNLMKGLRKLLMVSMITFLMVIMGRYLIGTCNIGNAMNSKKDLGTDENGNGKMARTIDPLFVQIL